MSDAIPALEMGAHLNLTPGVGGCQHRRSNHSNLGRLVLAQLVGSLRAEHRVEAGRPAALVVRQIYWVVTGGPENDPRLLDDTLGVAQMAGILDGYRTPEPVLVDVGRTRRAEVVFDLEPE